MTDPFAILRSPIAEVRQMSCNRTLDLWRQSNIALPDLHVIDRSDTTIPKSVGEDGQEMTFERRQQLMAGKTPMFTASDPSNHATAQFSGASYTLAFEMDIAQEPLGESAIANRPKGLRVFKPVVWSPVEDQLPELTILEA